MTHETPHYAPGNHPTTTHAGWGAGEPHLLISRGDEHFIHHLTADLTRIGSDGGCDVLVADTALLHATILHDDNDEYVLTLHGDGEMNARATTAGDAVGEHSEILRTGARFTAGPWTFVFARAEFADHGRPYGGREGGELSDQPPQPMRPDYDAERGRAEDESGAQYEVKDG